MEARDFKAWPAGSMTNKEPSEDVLHVSPSLHHDGALYVYAKMNEDAAPVAFHLPRKELEEFVRVAQDFLEETAPPLPTLPHATIKAKLAPDGTERVLTLVEPYQEPSWVAHDEGMSADWFSSEAIVSFEVLFPGVEA